MDNAPLNETALGADLAKNLAEPSLIKSYLDVIRRRFWVLMPVFVVVFTIGTIRAYRRPPVYQAAATIQIEKNQPRILGMEVMTSDGMGWDPDYYATQAQLIRSRAVLEMALENPELAAMFQSPSSETRSSFAGEIRRTLISVLRAPPPEPPLPWERLRDEVAATHQMNTHFLNVKSTGRNPERAAKIANAVARTFEKYNIKQKTQSLDEAYTYLSAERDREERAIKMAEEELQTFRRTTKGVSPTATEGDQAAADRLVKLNQRLTEVQIQRYEASSQLAVLRQVLARENRNDGGVEEVRSVILVVNFEPALAEMQKSLSEAERELAQLADVYGPDHPSYKSARSKVTVLRGQLVASANQAMASLGNRLEALGLQEKKLQQEYDDQRSSNVELAKESFTLIHLDNNVERHRKLWEALSQKAAELGVSAGLQRPNVRVIGEASVPRVPMPGKRRSVIVSAILALILGIGLAFAVENIDDTITTPEDLRLRLNVPLLGFVPKVQMDKKDGERKSQAFVYRGLLAVWEPMSSAAEAFRHIRTSLFYSFAPGAVHVLSVTSSSPREGKTTTSSNLAVVIAQSGKRTLLVDGDLHRPDVHHVFGIHAGLGLTDVLAGTVKLEDAVRKISYQNETVENLHILTAGTLTRNPGEICGSDKMRELLAVFRMSYDWVIIDTPPVLFVSDASILSAMCDGAILVVGAGTANWSIVRRTSEQLQHVKVRLLGAVLNNVSLSRMGRAYSSYYYHGYSRYSKDYHKSYYDNNRPDYE